MKSNIKEVYFLYRKKSHKLNIYFDYILVYITYFNNK
jgi:hypothetical protein